MDEQAARWRMRWGGSGLQGSEREEFDRWLGQSPEHRAAFDGMNRAWDAVGNEAGEPEMRVLREEALRYSPPSRFPARTRWVALAATVLLGAGVCWLWLGGHSLHTGVERFAEHDVHDTSDPIMTVQRVKVGQYETRVGERAILRLIDGTTVTLDTASRAKFDLTGGDRQIRLLAGRANFEVAQDAQRPFVVYAADRKITALGTSFDVRLDPREVKVTLVEGRVAVEQLEGRKLHRSSSDTGAVRAELEPGEELLASIGGGTQVEGTDLRRETSWREGRLVFENDRLDQAVEEMNRYAVMPIVLSDAAIGDLRVSGVFRTGQPRAFAHALTEYFGVDAVEEGDTVVLRWRR